MGPTASAFVPGRLLRRLAVALAGVSLLCCLLRGRGRAAAPAPALTADAVRELQKSYQTERAAADTSGAAKKFSPEWYEKADALAKRGAEALEGGRLVEA